MTTAQSPRHHPHPEHLLDYTTATASAAETTAIAAHLAFCGDCRASVQQMSALGGALLAESESDRVSDSLFDKMAGRLPAPEDFPAEIADAATELPDALAAVIAHRADELTWNWKAPGIQGIPLFENSGDNPGAFCGELLRIHAGGSVPSHEHRGEEFTVVLQGGYRDGLAHYRPGDLAFATPEINHQPVADLDGDCICYVAYANGLTLTGPVGRWFNWIMR